MPPYRKHVFVCTNRREPGHPKGCCAEKGAEEVRAKFKDALKARGISKDIRPNAAGCLDTCVHGVSVVVYPDGTWYGGVKVEDVDEIIDEHLINGRPVERLLMPFMKKKAQQ